MKVKIEIECDTINEFSQHLKALSMQIKKSAKKQKLNPDEDEFQAEDADTLSDNNCYGTHDVIIEPYSPTCEHDFTYFEHKQGICSKCGFKQSPLDNPDMIMSMLTPILAANLTDEQKKNKLPK